MFRFNLVVLLFSLCQSDTLGQTFPLADNALHPLSVPFDSTAQNDWRIVRLMAELSFLAYEDSIPSVQNRLKLNGLELRSFTTIENHHFVSAWDPIHRTLVIAFRGTDVNQLADFYTDLDYTSRPTNFGNVHQGFFNAEHSLHGAIAWELQQKAPAHIWLTGHSLGGAIATLCAAELHNSGRRFSGLVTFGQPRVGDRVFAETINREFGSRILRVVNEDDIVVSLPPRLPAIRPYYNAGCFIQFANGTLETSTGVRIMAKPAVQSVDDLFGPPTQLNTELPRTPTGVIPPDPDQLTVAEFEELKKSLRDDPTIDEPKAYGASPPLVGGIFDSLNFKRRAGHHPMVEYIKQIERYEASERLR